MISLDITITSPAIQLNIELNVAQTGSESPIDIAHGSEELYNP